MSDFEFIGRHAIYDLDFTVVNSGGAVVNADTPPVGSFHDYATNTSLWSRATLQVATGVYRLTLSSVETATPGLYYVKWKYKIGGIDQQYTQDVEIASRSTPLYSTLDVESRAIVDAVWARFEDGFDSRLGGPHLQEYAQSGFGREKVAELLTSALGLLNTSGQPPQAFTLAAANFPYAQWGALLETATTIEVIKHLMRGYTEQPLPEGINKARLDRRDYLNRWQTILDIETRAFEGQIPYFRMALMNIGNPSILVAGGLYGNFSGWRTPARPRRPMPPAGW